MNFKKSLAIFALLSSSLNVYSYSVVDRFKIVDDKLKTDQWLRPFGHDFLFDVSAALNTDVQDFINDVNDAKTVTAAQSVLNRYENTEQTLKINVNLGIPLFSFTAWDVKVRPNIRAMVDVGANLGVRRDVLTAADALSLFNVAVPAGIAANLTTAWDNTTAGNDLFSTSNCSTYFNTPAEANLFCLANQNKYFKPDSSIPNLHLFLKAQAKVGLFNQYTYGEHFFGDFNLYSMAKADVFQLVNYKMISSGQEIELPKKANTETSLISDYHFGYKNANYSMTVGVEELKLAVMSERKAESKEHVYGYDPLIRVHGQAQFRLSAFSFEPFAGVHKRSGYGFADGVYVGSAVGAHLWGDRLGLSLRGMLDKQYFTINPRIKLWLMQLDYSLKNPVKSKDGDVKLSAIHSIDFRLFF